MWHKWTKAIIDEWWEMLQEAAILFQNGIRLSCQAMGPQWTTQAHTRENTGFQNTEEVLHRDLHSGTKTHVTDWLKTCMLWQMSAQPSPAGILVLSRLTMTVIFSTHTWYRFYNGVRLAWEELTEGILHSLVPTLAFYLGNGIHCKPFKRIHKVKDDLGVHSFHYHRIIMYWVS